MYEGRGAIRAGICVPPLSPICGSRIYFPWEGVKLDSDYSGSAALSNFLRPSSLRGFLVWTYWSLFGGAVTRVWMLCFVLLSWGTSSLTPVHTWRRE